MHKSIVRFTYSNVLVYKSHLYAKLYQKLLISQGKPLSLLTMNLRQKLYRCHVLLKVTDAHKESPGRKPDWLLFSRYLQPKYSKRDFFWKLYHRLTITALVDNCTGLFHSFEKQSFFKQFTNAMVLIWIDTKFCFVDRYFIISVTPFGSNF